MGKGPSFSDATGGQCRVQIGLSIERREGTRCLLFEGKDLSNDIEEPSKIKYLAIYTEFDIDLSSCTGKRTFQCNEFV